MTAGHLAPFVPRIAVDWSRLDPSIQTKRIDGALVFVDVSGFTAMSERLASLGREGAERVTGIINSAFTALLEKAYDVDGSLLKFGGDALLILFDGDESAARAARAAFDMRARLAEVGRVETPAGDVQLRMSAGVHAGEIDMFLVGTSHRELIISGPGGSAVVEAEGAAGAGRIVVTPGAAEHLDASVLGRKRGPGRLLLDAPIVGDSGLVIRPKHSVDFSGLISTGLRAHLADPGRDRSEHRQAAVGFIHFEGIDAIVETKGPREAAKRLHKLVTATQVAADENGVCFLASDVDLDGGKIILTGGVPKTAGDDADRILLALRSVADSGQPVEIRMGVHGGALFAGEVGPPYRRTYTVMGDVVNTSARVMSKAQPGQILATDEILSQSKTTFGLTRIEPFKVKGKRKPLEASIVGDVTAHAGDASATDDGSEPELVGRSEEIYRLRALISDSLAGHGTHASLVGQPGSGKTRLYNEALAHFPEVDPVIIRGFRARQHVAYAPLRRALRLLIDYRPDLPARVIDPIREALDTEAESSDTDHGDRRLFRRRLHRAVEELFVAMYPAGAVLIVDDYQWLDEASQALFDDLAAATSRRPWLALSVYNDNENPPARDAANRISVRPLDRPDAEALVRATSSEPLLPQTVRAVVERGAGNPAFLCELAQTAGRGGELPDTIEALVAAHIDRLSPGDRSLLRQLSVFGSSFEIADAEQFFDHDERLVRRLQPLTAFLEIANGVVLFRQNLVHEVAYSGLPFAQRRRTHLEYGDHLERTLADPTQAADTLADHFWHGGDHARAHRYAAIAGRQAEAQYAFADAASHLARAAKCADALSLPNKQRSTAWRDLGKCLHSAGRPADAIEPLRRARGLVPDKSVELAILHLAETEARRELGQYRAAVRWCQSAIRFVDEIDSTDARRQAARLRLALAAIRFDQGKLNEARRILTHVLSAAEDADDEAAIAMASLWLQQVASRQRDPEGRAHGHRALEIYERLGRRREIAQVRNALGTDEFQVGNWARAVEHYDAAHAVLSELEDAVGSAVTAHNAGEILLDQGRMTEAARRLELAMQIFAAADHTYRWIAAASLAPALVWTRDERAEVLHRTAVSQLRSFGLEDQAIEAEVAWADAVQWSGYQATVSLPVEVDEEVEPRLLRLRSRIALYGENPSGATELAGEALAKARALDDPHQIALAYAVIARISEPPQKPTIQRLSLEQKLRSPN